MCSLPSSLGLNGFISKIQYRIDLEQIKNQINTLHFYLFEFVVDPL